MSQKYCCWKDRGEWNLASRIASKLSSYLHLANNEHYHGLKIQCERLARAYLRLAEQAERNSQLDLTYETPPVKRVEAGRS